MSGETEREVSGWTVDTLHALMDTRFTASDKATAAALAAAEKATDKADAALEKRFDGVNEFRQTLSDQTKTFMPRAEVESRYDGLLARLAVLEQRDAEAHGRGAGLNTAYSIIVSAIVVAIALYSALHH